MVTRTDYTALKVEAARRVMIEITHLLAKYRNEIVLVGGWVPELLCRNRHMPHVGSMDVDLALDHRKLEESGYKTIQELLSSRGYRQGAQPYIFHRSVPVGGGEMKVEVDLLSGEYEGTGRRHRHQRVQGVQARKARGCDLAFEIAEDVTIEGELPEGGRDSVTIRVASMVAFIVMKGMVLDERLKEKDAYDIYYCLRYYPGGLLKLIREFRSHIRNGLVREGLTKIARHFASTTHHGPVSVVRFLEITDPEERERLQRDAYERVNHLLQSLEIR